MPRHQGGFCRLPGRELRHIGRLRTHRDVRSSCGQVRRDEPDCLTFAVRPPPAITLHAMILPSPGSPVLNQLSIILPAKNEAPALATLLPQLRAAHPDAEIIVVDDGSTDDTRGICESNGVQCLSSPYSMGNGAAIKRGTRAASGDILVFMDGDGQHDPADVARLLDQLDRGYDMVVGARDWSSQAGVGRGIANTVYNWLATKMTGHAVLDLTSGFRAVRA